MPQSLLTTLLWWVHLCPMVWVSFPMDAVRVTHGHGCERGWASRAVHVRTSDNFSLNTVVVCCCCVGPDRGAGVGLGGRRPLSDTPDPIVRPGGYAAVGSGFFRCGHMDKPTGLKGREEGECFGGARTVTG